MELCRGTGEWEADDARSIRKRRTGDHGPLHPSDDRAIQQGAIRRRETGRRTPGLAIRHPARQVTVAVDIGTRWRILHSRVQSQALRSMWCGASDMSLARGISTVLLDGGHLTGSCATPVAGPRDRTPIAQRSPKIAMSVASNILSAWFAVSLPPPRRSSRSRQGFRQGDARRRAGSRTCTPISRC